MKNELVSVIITTYKRSDKLEKAILSVINQTYRNLEIIVVDDNANNIDERIKTEEIVNKYKNIILVENKKNMGGALSRNEGIKKAKGTFISFLDDDDQYLPERIDKMLKAYYKKNNNNIGLIYCNSDQINDKDEIIGEIVRTVDGLPLYEQMLNCICATSMWIVRKDILNKIGNFEDSPCKQDSIVLLKLIANNYEILCVNEKLVYYYMSGTERISGYKKTNIIGTNNYRTWCRKYYHLLKSKQQIKEVESNFSYNLITLYIINKMNCEARQEIKNIAKNKFFSSYMLKALIKYLFRNIYLKKINGEKLNIKSSLKKIYNFIYFQINRFRNINIYDDDITINKIIDEKMSVSRFGDGEFKWILNVNQQSFQENNEEMSNKLKKVLMNDDNKNLLVCVPITLKSVESYTNKTSAFWMDFLRWYGKKTYKLLNKKQYYGNSLFTRWYLEHNYSNEEYIKYVKKLKMIWNKKNILIVEGAGSKIGVGNDLLDNANCVKRIIAPSSNAYSKYDEILLSVLDNAKKIDMVLIALGPTATILAYELSKNNIQALDLGHIDIEYEWFKKGVKEKTSVEGKSVNEAGTIENNINSSDSEDYIKSIIKIIGDEK